jgi:hypothetical protein
MDDCIVKGEIEEGQTLALDVTSDASGARVGRFEITFDRLSHALQRMHVLANTLAAYKDREAAPSPTAT